MKTKFTTIITILLLACASFALAQDKPVVKPVVKPVEKADEKKAPGISNLARQNAAQATTPAQPTPPPPTQRGPSRGGFGGPRGPRGPQLEPANITLNFMDAPIDSVLSYLSEAAGFSILYDETPTGNVSVKSLQPQTKTQIVELLNTVLYKKGYAAVREENTLVIVSLANASKSNMPVKSGNNPEDIPMSDRVVTQIIPVRYANAQEMTAILEPLLPETANMSASQTSNALIITDSQKNIRRMAEIIQALDTTISDISTIRVYPLINASATDTAAMITSLFSGQSAGARGGGGTTSRFGGDSPFGGRTGGSPFGGRTGGTRTGGGRGGR
ncbi:MAG: type II secretory pathway component GspD/PulD (secretin) [Limisphaerales bacterium]|jgi:type II secretory pathway component GspD/PulD (secretin)